MWYCLRVVAGFTWQEAFRSRLFVIHLVLLILAFFIGNFLGAVAITEQTSVRTGLMGPLLRLYATASLTLFAAGSFAREWHDKSLYLVIALPHSRATYFFGRLAGLLLVSTTSALLLSSILLLDAPAHAVGLWAVSLVCELAIVMTVALVTSITWQQSPAIALSVAAFYVLARSITAMQLIGHGPLSESVTVGQQLVTSMIDALAYILPALQRYTQTEWLSYPETALWQNVVPNLMQSCIYISVLSALGLYDLYRKNF